MLVTHLRRWPPRVQELGCGVITVDGPKCNYCVVTVWRLPFDYGLLYYHCARLASLTHYCAAAAHPAS